MDFIFNVKHILLRSGAQVSDCPRGPGYRKAQRKVTELLDGGQPEDLVQVPALIHGSLMSLDKSLNLWILVSFCETQREYLYY